MVPQLPQQPTIVYQQPLQPQPLPTMVSHAMTINQTDNGMSVPMTADEHVECLRRYEALFGPGRRPPPEAEPSADQLAAVAGLLKGKRCPYVDFAVFGPHGARTARKMK